MSFKERWNSLWRPRSKWLLGIPIGGYLLFLVGILFTAGTYVSIEATSTNEFCTSCHSMQAFTLPEYQDSIHYSNAHGIVASCSDCHVPQEWGPKIVRKVTAGIRDAIGELSGKIDTKEKYEAHRLEMAQTVWTYMRERDSQECRNCHQAENMLFEAQDRRAARAHQRAFEAGEKTCIDCHTGVAHVEPELPLPPMPTPASQESPSDS